MASRAGSARLLVLLLCAALLSGCSYAQEEPGLFGRSVAPSAPSPDVSIWPRTNPELPVVGEAVWTAGNGSKLTVRIAVHAVRRLPGATVLDWSVTPVRGHVDSPRSAGAPPTPDLGLSTSTGPQILLLDVRRGRAYRPLRQRAAPHRCLCTSVRRAQWRLSQNQSTLLQVAFPPLPASTPTIDVDIASVPLFSRVPVSPVGTVPLATSPSDLSRTPEELVQPPSGAAFAYPGPDGQRFLLGVDELVASPTSTSLRWTLEALDPGPGLEGATRPPIGDPGRPRDADRAASGPLLRFGRDETRRTLVLSTQTAGRVECLCRQLGDWTSGLRVAGGAISLVTNFATLPAAVREVEVVFPGLGGRRIAVTPAADASTRSAGPVGRRVPTWRPTSPQPVWTSDQWPTPVPDPSVLSGYAPVVERLVG